MNSRNIGCVMIVMPALIHVGGVSSFYKNLRIHFPPNDVEYFEYKSSRDDAGFVSIIGNYLKYTKQLLRPGMSLVCLNPSMARSALIRDGLYAILARIFGKKVIVFFHGWNPNTVANIENRWLFLFKSVFLNASAIIVLSPEFRDKLEGWGYSGPVTISTTHVPDEYLALKDLSEYSDQGAMYKFKILFFSRIERTKGISEALECFDILRKKYAFVTMDCVGGGGELEYWKNYAEKNSIPAVFHGEVYGDEKLKYFMDSDCYIFPSYSEGMPTAVLEAMAVGLPVVTHSVGGLKYMFQDGIMGFIIDGLSPRSYSDAIERLIQDRPRIAEMAKANSNYVGTHCTSRIIAREMMHLFSLIR